MVDEPEQEGQDEASNPVTSAERLTELSADPHLRLVVANNPSAPVKLLEHLSQDQDEQVRQAVAGNPNTPWKTLEQLAWEFPRTFLHNPVGPLQILGHPEQITTDGTFWNALLREASFPPLWWRWLGDHQTWDTREAVRLHIQSAGETPHFAGDPQEDEVSLYALVELLTAVGRQGVPLPVLQLPDQSTTTWERIVEEHLQRLAHAGGSKFLLTDHSLTPEAVLRALVQDPDVRVRERIARHSRTPEEALRILAQDPAVKVREGVAEHPRTPEEALRILAQDPDWSMRRRIAEHPRTPEGVLRILLQDEDRDVRSAAMHHPHMPEEILRSLAQDPDWSMRRRIAEHPRTPEGVLRILAQDSDHRVREGVASHPRTPEEVLRILLQDPDVRVRQTVYKHPRMPVEGLCILIHDPDQYIRRCLAQDPRMPMEGLCALAQDPDVGVRKIVDWNSQTPEEILRALAQDPDVGVRKMIVLNAQVPEEILHTLAQNEDKGLQYLLCLRGKVEGLEYKKGGQDPVWLWRDPGMWLKDIEDFLERGNNHATIAEQLIDVVTKLSLPDPLLQAIIANLAAHWDDSIKTEFEDDWIDLTYDSDGSEGDWRELLAAAFMPPIALRKLASSPGWKVRYLVALHPQTPWETRQQLCQDGNRYVRAMARATSEQIPRPA